MSEPKGARLIPLCGFYFFYFGTLGIVLPFFPAYLKSQALSVSQIGVLLALPPLFSLFAPPLWSRLADRSGRADLVLCGLSFGALASFSLVLVDQRFAALLLVISAYALFNSAITPLIDSLTWRRIGSGGGYARIRLFGSLGFVLSSALFGISAAQIDRVTVLVALCLMAGYFAWSLALRAGPVHLEVGPPLKGIRLLNDRNLAVFLCATCLHWIACAPFHGTFAIHLQSMRLSPSVVGICSGVGVLAETAFMYFYPRFFARTSEGRLLFAAFLASAFRWTGMAFAERSGWIILLSLLHAFTFGAFYIASVAYVASRTPSALRAAGQGLFVAITFGAGGLIGYLVSGVGYDVLGGHRLFGAAAFVELAAAWVILQIKSEPSLPAGQPLTPAGVT